MPTVGVSQLRSLDVLRESFASPNRGVDVRNRYLIEANASRHGATRIDWNCFDAGAFCQPKRNDRPGMYLTSNNQ